jgi:hypothetical protein
MPSYQPFMVNTPLAFEYDQDTGLLSVVAVASMQRQTTEKADIPTFEMNLILYLTPETARRLLSDLPKLEMLLRQASEGPPTPRSVQ